ncbi:uncharacterized protein LOC112093781 [Morus notabilis]|uniref:uncharacterized protein LOC112093781 n=1 Tax=Morus notabilis TaxID=981085 RepID=UPI000CED7070|nr:uncharacterized protein LOC112093781 [Morus notabilis]
MDFLREGGSVSHPPLLDGCNDSYWKVRMKAFIKALDEKAWRAVLIGWTHPVTKNDAGEEAMKPEEKWSTEEDRLANSNSRALNAIFNEVDANQFKLISTCEMAKEAWEILQMAHEGTTAVRLSKLQILTTRFENLRMLEDETIFDFNSKLCDIANEAFALGEKISEEKLVRKVLRSLPRRFAYKVTAIEEAKDIQTMKLDELMGSLRTFEMNLDENKEGKKEKSITLQAKVDYDDEEDLAQSITKLSKKFNKVMKKVNRKNENSRNGNSSNFQKNKAAANNIEMKTKNRGIQCRECDGYGHIQSECANTLKKKKKSFNATWSDEDSEGSPEDEDHVSNYVAFNVYTDQSVFVDSVTKSVADSVATLPVTDSVNSENGGDFSDSESDSDGEELTIDATQESYKTMFSKWIKVCEMNKSLREQVGELVKENDVLKRVAVNNEFQATKNEKKLQDTRAELESTQKNLKMMNSGTTKLDHILSIGKASCDRHGLGYTVECSTSKTVFVKETHASEPRTTLNKKVIISPPRRKRFVPICHYCGLAGHIRPRCYKYLNALKRGMLMNPPNSANSRRTPKARIDVQNKFPRRVWVRKSDLRCHRTYTSLEACTNGCVCSNGGWSKHLTGDNIKFKRVLHSGGVRLVEDSGGATASKRLFY